MIPLGELDAAVTKLDYGRLEVSSGGAEGEMLHGYLSHVRGPGLSAMTRWEQSHAGPAGLEHDGIVGPRLSLDPPQAQHVLVPAHRPLEV